MAQEQALNTGQKLVGPLPKGMVGRIVLRPERRAPVREVEETVAIAGQGLEGDHAQGGRRQVTLLCAEEWEEATTLLGVALPPSCRRANIVVTGIDLKAAIGKEVRIGEVVVRVEGYNPACGRMNEQAVGLREILEAKQRAGVFGAIIKGGQIRVGMSVQVAASIDIGDQV